MSASTTAIEEFQRFLSEQSTNGSCPLTSETAVDKFRQLEKLRADLAESRAQAERGESGPLDLDALKGSPVKV
jgi:hypothetical protein